MRARGLVTWVGEREYTDKKGQPKTARDVYLQDESLGRIKVGLNGGRLPEVGEVVDIAILNARVSDWGEGDPTVAFRGMVTLAAA